MEKIMMLDPRGAGVRPGMATALSNEGEEGSQESDHCILLCKKLGPNVFFVKNGLAIIDEARARSGTEALSVTCPTKIVFLPEEALV